MKTLFNMTTDSCDLTRFKNREEFEQLLPDFDGVELMYMGGDACGIIQKEQVVGFHMHNFSCWLDMWNEDEKALLDEFGTTANYTGYYGGNTRDRIAERLRAELARALSYEAEYVVFHVSDAGAMESQTRRFHHTDEEVVDAACELINLIFCENPPVRLLLENLWYPGFTFTKPEITERMLKGIKHKNTGIMLDTGHLFHTNTALRTQEDGVKYIHEMLNLHGELCDKIQGIHLNQSLTGAFAEWTKSNPPSPANTFDERVSQLYTYIFQIDLHRPFTGEGVWEMIKRISPDYLTFELITSNLEAHKKYLQEQKEALQEQKEALLQQGGRLCCY